MRDKYGRFAQGQKRLSSVRHRTIEDWCEASFAIVRLMGWIDEDSPAH